MPDRRESTWSDPRVIVSIVQVFIGLAGLAVTLMVFVGAIVGVYVVMQTRDATTEVSNAQLAREIAIIGQKVDKVGSDVGLTNTQVAEMSNKVSTVERDIERETSERKAKESEHNARLIALEKTSGELSAAIRK